MTGIPLARQIACLRRELGNRRRTYPAHVRHGRMTESEARNEIEECEAALTTLCELGPRPTAEDRADRPVEPGATTVFVTTGGHVTCIGPRAGLALPETFLRHLKHMQHAGWSATMTGNLFHGAVPTLRDPTPVNDPPVHGWPAAVAAFQLRVTTDRPNLAKLATATLTRPGGADHHAQARHVTRHSP